MLDKTNRTIAPDQIEARSFEIITEILGDRTIPPENEKVVKRVIHTTADFEFYDSLTFSEGAVRKGIEALKAGCDIVCDTKMVAAGISKTTLTKFGGEVHCYISDEDVASKAKADGTTRAAKSIDKSLELHKDVIYAIGNAPTALIQIYEHVKAGRLNPKLIIAVPVGFVNVVESKELIASLTEVPSIIAMGRKGGSNIAAAIVNAMLYQVEI
jgi:precorrin-8X/cobalt-precorrin-8 methylmutase